MHEDVDDQVILLCTSHQPRPRQQQPRASQGWNESDPRRSQDRVNERPHRHSPSPAGDGERCSVRLDADGKSMYKIKADNLVVTDGNKLELAQGGSCRFASNHQVSSKQSSVKWITQANPSRDLLSPPPADSSFPFALHNMVFTGDINFLFREPIAVQQQHLKSMFSNNLLKSDLTQPVSAACNQSKSRVKLPATTLARFGVMAGIWKARSCVSLTVTRTKKCLR
jgi:hypothetical protein